MVMEHQVWIVVRTEVSRPSWQAAMKLRRQVMDMNARRAGENTVRRVCRQKGGVTVCHVC